MNIKMFAKVAVLIQMEEIESTEFLNFIHFRQFIF